MRGRQVKDLEEYKLHFSFHCCYCMIWCHLRESPVLLQSENYSFWVFLFFGRDVLMRRENGLQKQQISKMIMPLHLCQTGCLLPDIQEYHSAPSSSKSLIAFHLYLFIQRMLFQPISYITKTTSLPDHLMHT